MDLASASDARLYFYGQPSTLTTDTAVARDKAHKMSLPPDIWFTIALDLIVEHLCGALTDQIVFGNPLPSLLLSCRTINLCTAQAVRTVLTPGLGQESILLNRPDQYGYSIIAKLLTVASFAHNQPEKRRPRNRVIRDLRPLAKSTPFIDVWVFMIDLLVNEIHYTIPNYALPPPNPPFHAFTLASIRKVTRIIRRLPPSIRDQLFSVTQYTRIRAAAWDKINTISNDVVFIAAIIEHLIESPHDVRLSDIQRIPTVIDTYPDLLAHSARFQEKIANRYNIESSQVPVLASCELALAKIEQCQWNGVAMGRMPEDAAKIWFLAQNYILSRFSFEEIGGLMRRYVCWRMNRTSWSMDLDIYMLP